MLRGICFPGDRCAGGRGGGEGFQGIHRLPACTARTRRLGYAHSLSLKYGGYKALKIEGYKPLKLFMSTSVFRSDTWSTQLQLIQGRCIGAKGTWSPSSQINWLKMITA